MSINPNIWEVETRSEVHCHPLRPARATDTLSRKAKKSSLVMQAFRPNNWRQISEFEASIVWTSEIKVPTTKPGNVSSIPGPRMVENEYQLLVAALL